MRLSTELIKKRQIVIRLNTIDTAKERLRYLKILKCQLSKSNLITTKTKSYEKRLKRLNRQINANVNIIDEEEHFFNNYL